MPLNGFLARGHGEGFAEFQKRDAEQMFATFQVGWEKLEGAAARNSLLYVAIFLSISYIYLGVFAATTTIAEYANYPDYLNMTAGNFDAVSEPFSGRLLGPLLARLLMRWTAVSPTFALAVVCAIGWAIVPILAGYLIFLDSVPLRWAVVVATLPFPAVSAGYYLVPDAWGALTVILFFIFLKKLQFVPGMLSASIAMLARSSSAFAMTLWSAAGPPGNRLRRLAACLGGIALGVAVKRFTFNMHSTNIHHMNETLYTAFRVPVNLARNLFGAQFYSNTVNWCSPPILTFDVSRIPGLGEIHTLGICALDLSSLPTSLICYLCVFGLLPTFLVIGEIRKGGSIRERLRRDCTPLVFLLFFLMTPGFGRAVQRLFIEAYPLAVVVAAHAIKANRSDSAAWLWLWIAYNLVSVSVLVFLLPR